MVLVEKQKVVILVAELEFRRESEMTPIATKWLEERNLKVRFEFVAYWGILDLVGVRLNPQKSELRCSLRQKTRIGSSSAISTLLLVPEVGSITAKELHENFRFLTPLPKIEKQLEAFRKRRFISVIDGGFRRVIKWLPLHQDIVTVELKLRDISGVIHQASSNCTMSTESYIGLPASVCNRLRDKRLTEISDKGLGLLLVSNSGCEVVIKPDNKKYSTSEVQMIHCCEKFW